MIEPVKALVIELLVVVYFLSILVFTPTVLEFLILFDLELISRSSSSVLKFTSTYSKVTSY